MLIRHATKQVQGFQNVVNFNFLTGSYANNSASSGVLSTTPGVTVTGATGYAQTVAGTLTAFSAGAPRRTDKGLLMELAATNIALQSQAVATTPWSTNNTTTTNNVTTAPDGATTAGSIIATVGNAYHWAEQIVSITAGSTYTVSGYLKAAGLGFAFVQFSNPGNTGGATCNFDLTTGAMTGLAALGTGTNVNATMEVYANGWWRWSLTARIDGAAIQTRTSICPATTSANQGAYVGDGVNGIYSWGFQQELGTVASSLAPTTTVAVTRAADVFTVAHTVPQSPSSPAARLYYSTPAGVANQRLVNAKTAINLGASAQYSTYAPAAAPTLPALPSSIVDVTSSATLATALASATAGTGIRMAPGAYTINVSGKSIAGGYVTFYALNPANPPSVTSISTNSATSGFVFRNLFMDIVGNGDQFYAFRFASGCQNMVFDGCNFSGTVGTVAAPYAILMQGCSNFVFYNCTLQWTYSGASVQTSNLITFYGCTITKIGSDGLHWAQCTNVVIANNAFSDFTPGTGDHPDAIQFQTAGTTGPSTDVLIANNSFIRNAGYDYMQGIFISDEIGTYPYQRFTVINNVLRNLTFSAIYFANMNVGAIINNIVSFDPSVAVAVPSQFPTVTYSRIILIAASGNTTIEVSGNESMQYSIAGGATTVTEATPNTQLGVVQNFGSSAATVVSAPWLGNYVTAFTVAP